MTQQEKDNLVALLKNIDVKKISIEHMNENVQKWYRFGAYMGLRVACDIIQELPELAKIEEKVS